MLLPCKDEVVDSYHHKNGTNRNKKVHMRVVRNDFLPMDEYIDSLSDNSPISWN